MRSGSLARAGAFTAVAALLGVQARADEAACRALQTSIIEQTTVKSTAFVAADPAKQAPAFCEVTALLSSGPKSRITAIYRLPEGWNGKMLGYGGGGWAGNVVVQTALPGLARGYATAQTDGGHSEGTSFDTAWMKDNPEALTDFAHRAVHLMTVVGKQVVAQYYGRSPQRSYFQGCSTGGRMGLMEAQRYPEDYDGIISGAPVNSLLVQTSTLIRDRTFKSEGAIPAALLPRVHAAVLAACDASDGVKDGILTDPRQCSWNPAELQCKASSSTAAGADACLTPAQVTALRQIYTTQRTSGGLVANYGLTRGSEGSWERFVPTTPGPRNAMNGDLGALRHYMFGDAAFDQSRFDPEQHQAAVHASAFAREYEASSPDMRAFFKRGGKLLLWHGFDDPGPSALATIDYYQQVRKVSGSDAAVRFYVMPGVYHCRGGPGADEADLLTPLENWVERGSSPTRVIARNVQSGISRPLCEYPALPYYRSGDARDAASFECRTSAGR